MFLTFIKIKQKILNTVNKPMFCRRSFVEFNRGEKPGVVWKYDCEENPVFLESGDCSLPGPRDKSSLESYFIFYKYTVLKRVSKMLSCKHLESF